MNKLNTLLLISLLAASPLALANHDGMGDHCGRHGAGMLSDADTNKDGSIDKAEAQALHEKQFDKMDANHDGKLSKDEISAAHPMHNGMHDKGSMGFKKADKNNDGKLTKDEAKVLPNVSTHFDEIDTDKDGTVDRDEVHNFMRDHMTK